MQAAFVMGDGYFIVDDGNERVEVRADSLTVLLERSKSGSYSIEDGHFVFDQEITAFHLLGVKEVKREASGESPKILIPISDIIRINVPSPSEKTQLGILDSALSEEDISRIKLYIYYNKQKFNED